MYEEVTGRHLKKWGPFYTDGRRLANGCDFLSLDIKANTDTYDNGKQVWYNLGANLLDDSIIGFNVIGDGTLYIPKLTKDKYIVIGSFDGDDMVSTFKGRLSGAVVNYNAFCSLKKGRHTISFGFALLVFVVFFVLSWWILNEEIRQKKKNSLMEKKRLGWRLALFLLLPLVTYSIVLQAFCVAVYLIFGKVFEVFLISTLFYYFALIVKLKNQIQQWQKKK